MSPRRKSRMSKKTRRELDKVGSASGFAYIADRADIVRAAKALSEELELEDADTFSLIELASFLAGDKSQED